MNCLPQKMNMSELCQTHRHGTEGNAWVSFDILLSINFLSYRHIKSQNEKKYKIIT